MKNIKKILLTFVFALLLVTPFVKALENDDIGKFYIMICENGGYYQVDMENSYWYEEDDGTVVFRVNDTD